MTQPRQRERKSPSSDLPKRVRIVEVAPRDGLQNEAKIVPTVDKVQFIEMLANAGLTDIEASSFVNPARVPQLADASEVFALLPDRPEVRFSALVPNRKGLERALNAGVRNIAFFTAASETFNRKNVGLSIAESLEEFRAMMPDAREAGCRVRAYISTAFVCPYEGRISPGQVLPVADALVSMGVDEISIGDTIGDAEPDDVARLCKALSPALPVEKTAFHFHDTRGTAALNVMMALLYGVTVFDSAAGGTGGCPFAPGAAGNLATEDLLLMLNGLGIETGVDYDGVAKASRFLETRLGRKLALRC